MSKEGGQWDKLQSNNNFYCKLDNKEGAKDISRLAKPKEKRNKDLSNIKYIKSADNSVSIDKKSNQRCKS